MTETERSCNILQTEVRQHLYGLDLKQLTVRYGCLYWIKSCITYVVKQSVRLLQGGRPTDDLKYLFSFSRVQLNASMATGFHEQKNPFLSLYH